MKNILYIHAGAFKTGSTSIQHFAYYNRDTLEKDGIIYPFFTSYDHKELTFWDNGERLSKILSLPKEETLKLMNAARNRLSELSTQYEDKKFFISSEFFFFMPKDELNKFKLFIENLFCKIYLIVYMRDPRELLRSWVSEAVKQGYHGVLDGCYEVKTYEMFSYLNNLEQFFPKKVIVKPYNLNVFNKKSLISDLLFTIGIDNNNNNNNNNIPRKNKTPTLEALVFCELIRKGYKENINLFWLDEIKGTKFMPPKSAMKIIIEECDPFLEKMRDQYNIAYDDINLDIYPDEIFPNFNYEVIKSIAEVFKNLLLNSNEIITIISSADILHESHPDISRKLKKIALKRDPDIISLD